MFLWHLNYFHGTKVVSCLFFFKSLHEYTWELRASVLGAGKESAPRRVYYIGYKCILSGTQELLNPKRYTDPASSRA